MKLKVNWKSLLAWEYSEDDTVRTLFFLKPQLARIEEATWVLELQKQPKRTTQTGERALSAMDVA